MCKDGEAGLRSDENGTLHRKISPSENFHWYASYADASGTPGMSRNAVDIQCKLDEAPCAQISPC